MPFSLRLRGKLDVQVLQSVVDELVIRHESLHTRFAADGDVPVLVFDKSLQIIIGHEQEAGATSAQVADWLAEKSALAFDLYNGPLLRVHLLETGAEDFRLLLVMHHIVSDAWSMSIRRQLQQGWRIGQPVAPITCLSFQFRAGQPVALPGSVVGILNR